MEVRIKLLDPRATVPTRGSAEAAGADLRTLDALTVPAHKTVQAHTGIAIELPVGYAALVYARSGMALKKGIAPANKVGVVDSDYRGEIMVSLHNHTDEDVQIEAGERIAQLVIAPVVLPDFVVCDSLGDTDRGAGGFGSTGTK
ncbi:MAG: dUTP diphosphatase [Clostridia bacterium]|nr:dUTP diphosphatase [Clostridia bacterium]